jgi:glyoxylase-like metal-dependent hydrolase (beta-lactamase superfamily II)
MGLRQKHPLSRRHFCLCCMTGAAFATTGGWLTPGQAFAEARGLVTLIKDSAASSPVTAYKLRGNVSVLEGSGGNIAVLTGRDGKVLIDGGIGVSRPQLTKTLSGLGGEPVTYLINTHWHFDHTDGNEWLHSVGAKIIAHENTHKHLSGIQRVEDWDYNFLPLAGSRDSQRGPSRKPHTQTQCRIPGAEALQTRPHRQRLVGHFRRG